MSQGPSLLETLTNAATTSEHRECVQGKEVAYGRKEGIAGSGKNLVFYLTAFPNFTPQNSSYTVVNPSR